MIKGGIGGLIVDIYHITYLARAAGTTGYPAQIFDFTDNDTEAEIRDFTDNDTETEIRDFTDNDTEAEIREVIQQIILPGTDEGDIPAFGS